MQKSGRDYYEQQQVQQQSTLCKEADWAYYGIANCLNWGTYQAKVTQLAKYYAEKLAHYDIASHRLRDFSNRVMTKFPSLEIWYNYYQDK